MILLPRPRRGTWGLLLLVMVDTQILTTELDQGYSLEVGSPRVGTWTRSCVSRYGNPSHGALLLL